jgi:hypothetical protein
MSLTETIKLDDGSMLRFHKPFFGTKREAKQFYRLSIAGRNGAPCRCRYCAETGAIAIVRVRDGLMDYAHPACFEDARGEPTCGEPVTWSIEQ